MTIDEYRKLRRTPASGNKYHAQKTSRIVGGEVVTFDSKREAERFDTLRVLQGAGVIEQLQRQVRYTLIPAQKSSDGKTIRGVDYVADFVYQRDGKTVVEDAKGMKTKEYLIKKKLMLWVLGIEIMEV